MTSLSLVLAILLGAAIVWAVGRERRWRALITAVSAAARLEGQSPENLPVKIAGLREVEGLLAKEEYLRRLFESLLNEIRQGVVIVDDQLRIKFSNRTMEQLFHRPAIRRGRTLLEALQDHQIVDTVQGALQNQRRSVREIEVMATADGNRSATTKHYLIESMPLPSTAEKGAWLMVYDITEQTLTDQIRRDFVANASHELRTPLTLINGHIELLQSGAITSETERHKCLAVMDKHGKRIARIIEDMLTISRLENGRSMLNIESFAVRDCVKDALDHLAPLIQGCSARIELDFPEDGGRIDADRFYWDQIFTNLIENAVKENPNPGLVVRVSGQWNPNHCVLKVSDNGIGISAHDLPFIFKRFYRGHKHHSPKIKGTGLGLSIVRRAIEAHGGTIEVTSTPGLDTTFTMHVPLRPE